MLYAYSRLCSQNCFQKANAHVVQKVADMPFVRDNELTVTCCPTIVRQVAIIYKEFPDLGFRAYDHSAVFKAAKHKLSEQSKTLNKGGKFLHIWQYFCPRPSGSTTASSKSKGCT